MKERQCTVSNYLVNMEQLAKEAMEIFPLRVDIEHNSKNIRLQMVSNMFGDDL